VVATAAEPAESIAIVVDTELDDLAYRAEFERQQFQVYETRRLAEETHANAVIAAAVAVAAFVLNDYGREGHPNVAWLIAALLGVVFVIVLAINARTVSWESRRWMRVRFSKAMRKRFPASRTPKDSVGDTLNAVRSSPSGLPEELRRRVIAHWHERQQSAWALGDLKSQRVRWALAGFAGPLAYFVARVVT
jgi:hypothetical protein